MSQSEKCIYKGRKFSFKCRYFKSPDGKEVFREYIDHPGSVVIIPVINSKILLIKQYRHVVRDWIFELPAGTLKLNEDPKECAYRELIEETGYKANELIKLFEMFLTPGYSNELMHVYLAKKLEYVGSKPEIGEVIEVIPMEISEVLKLIEENKVRDAKTIASILYYVNYVNKK